MRTFSGKSLGWIAIILLFLCTGRVMLPYIVKDYIDERLNETQGYSGHVQDVSLSLLAGRIKLYHIKFEKTNAQGIKPIISVKSIIIALNWPSLWQGNPHTKVLLDSPDLSFVEEKPQAHAAPVTPIQAWRMVSSRLLPLKIDAVYIENGTLYYENRTAKPVFDINITDIQADLAGLQGKATGNRPLPARLRITAKAFGQADASFDLRFNPKAKTPAFKLEAQMEHLRLNQMNDFLHRYTKLQAKQGEFSFYLEASAKQGKITGYIKPFLQGLQTELPKEDKANVLKKAYKAIVQAAGDTLKNDNSKQVATQIDISGDINSPDVSIGSVIANLLQNAFLKALLPGIDHSIKSR